MCLEVQELSPSMMSKEMLDMPHYSDEKNVQITLALLKAHGIKRIIANPGSSNFSFVGSVQSDPDFIVYSGVDERHSAYMACGMSAESGEPVILNCTGATSSRDYMPALTEAYYRKLPILVITSSQVNSHLGQLWAQMTDRLHPPSDVVKLTVDCPVVKTEQDAEACSRFVNQAILELKRNGGGPVHINLQISHCTSFSATTLPRVRKIDRVSAFQSEWPALKPNAKILVWIGSHKSFSGAESAALADFIANHNAVVLCDHTSSYTGYGAVTSSIVCSQGIRNVPKYCGLNPDLIIHIGEISGDAPTNGYLLGLAPVWRISEDGEIRDRLGSLEYVFEMPEMVFFNRYKDEGKCSGTYAEDWSEAVQGLRDSIPDLPFSNPWMAQRLCGLLPRNSCVHFAILNSLRSWNYFDKDDSISSMCNVGGFGIDGCTSSLIGASLVNHDKLYYLVTGDLAFFYDLNALGNRHIGSNVRILLVNNGAGGEFNMYNNATSRFGERTNDYIAAGGHFGDRSKTLVKHFAEDLGFMYLSATDKTEFDEAISVFTSAEKSKSIIFECFTSLQDESMALEILNKLDSAAQMKAKYSKYVPSSIKRIAKKVLR